MLPAIASAIFFAASATLAVYYLKSYRPTRVPVVEQALAPQDMRAKLKLRKQRRTVRNQTTPTPAPNRTPVPVAVSTQPAPAPAPAYHLVQPTLAHQSEGSPAPGSYFGVINAPSPETILSDVRGPWAAPIIASDGRITLPDNGMDVAVTWQRSNDALEPGAYLS